MKYTVRLELAATCAVEVEANSPEDAIAKADYRDVNPEEINVGESRFLECQDEDGHEFDENGESIEPWKMPTYEKENF
jgi:hypothetical protein